MHGLVPCLFVGAAGTVVVGAEDVPKAVEGGAPLAVRTAGTLNHISFPCLINIVSLWKSSKLCTFMSVFQGSAANFQDNNSHSPMHFVYICHEIRQGSALDCERPVFID